MGKCGIVLCVCIKGGGGVQIGGEGSGSGLMLNQNLIFS
jgi:hypothetical protein